MGIGALGGGSLVCLFGGVQALGLLASMSSRVAQGTRFESLAQWGCLAGLALVGALCGFAVQYGPGAAATSAVTLLAMTMIAVVDVRVRD